MADISIVYITENKKIGESRDVRTLCIRLQSSQ